MSFITSYCHLTNKSCFVNGQLIAARDTDSQDSWLKQLYKEQEIVYPKFYKMDTLSQTGFILTELLKKANSNIINAYQDDEIALLFANRFSSVDSDVRFKRSYQEQASPSPALFVYTLPNIVLGELAIYNKWYGENMFAVLPKFAADFYINYVEILLSTGSGASLCGWLDIADEKIDAFLFFVEKEGKGNQFNIESLQKLAGLI
ncbi:hypothetical protein [Dyadobacter psychrotolerans]|uniref:3-oxoacyl-ACP synthase n=1 Tax=Dyadobacter psychrotolerans TaxID=2541721 RepID=A0A4R5DIF6_9BACT|nr:hypothetical protein [Dyadobacter psychrotolerans]TDE10283.1 hypothetical protein E0F88_28745 [Dyadobacter psychrotolerans]